MASNGMEGMEEKVRYFVLHSLSKIYHEIGPDGLSKCAIQANQAFSTYTEPPEGKTLCGECMKGKGDTHG